MTPIAWATWRTGYVPDDGTDLQARALLERSAAAIRAEGGETTIGAVWVSLADRAATEGTPDIRAAAALAGMALGLVPV